jgi:hypothetical protein
VDDAFARGIDGWHDFYLLVGTASATLVGLLFLALSLNADILHRDEFGAVRALARRSFFAFINLVVVSGVMLIPQQSPRGVGVPLVCIGGLSFIGTIRRTVQDLRGVEREWEMLRDSGLMLVGMAALITVGILLWSGQSSVLNWLTGAILALLSVASQSAWKLLTLPRNP